MDRAADQPLHADAEPLAFLLGTWRGQGDGRFHSTEPFAYEEEIRFSHRGGPWLVYEQRAWSQVDESLLHTEMGFWRLVEDGKIYAFIALTAGSDFSEGTLEGTSVSLETTAAPMAEGIETVVRLTRDYQVDDDAMTYEIHLGTDQQPFERHLAARLRRV